MILEDGGVQHSLTASAAMAQEVKKKRALEHFLRLLLERARERVAKVILFGSVARGESGAQSDVDLLVFGTGKLSSLLDVCADAQLDTWCEFFESVEPVVKPLAALQYPNSPFLQEALKHGQEVYGMDEEEIKKAKAQGHLELSEIFLEDARDLFARKRYRSAIDLAYNAAEHCAKGFLSFKLDQLPSSHGGTVGEFGRLFVRTGELDRELGRGLGRGLSLRSSARYDPTAHLSEAEAREQIDLAELLIKRLEEKLRTRGHPDILG